MNKPWTKDIEKSRDYLLNRVDDLWGHAVGKSYVNQSLDDLRKDLMGKLMELAELQLLQAQLLNKLSERLPPEKPAKPKKATKK